MNRTLRYTFAGAALAAALAGCSQSDSVQETAVQERVTGSLTAALTKADGMAVVARALDETGIDGAIDSPGSYTLFAPNDAAFAALGEAGNALESAEGKPALAALLRDHIVPGYVTPDDIAKSLATAKGGQVKMRTLGEGEISFAKAGDAIKVTAADGSSATFAGKAIAGETSVAIPVDAVLRKIG